MARYVRSYYRSAVNSRSKVTRLVAIVIVLIGTLMYLGWLYIPGLVPYAFWVVLIGFAVSLFR